MIESFTLRWEKTTQGKNIKMSKKNQNETTIDLEKDPKTQEYKPKE